MTGIPSARVNGKGMMMKASEIKTLAKEAHMGELAGIASALIMTVVSYIPVLRTYEMQQLAIVVFFLTLFALKLCLFLWNRSVAGTEREAREQAKMMLVSAIVLLLMHATFLIAVLYQLLIKDTVPLMASTLILAIAYAVYTTGKVAVSIRSIVVKRKMNQYIETLSYLSWISAVYTLCLCTDYLLIAKDAYNYIWLKYIMISLMGLTNLILGLIMIRKAVKVLRSHTQVP